MRHFAPPLAALALMLGCGDAAEPPGEAPLRLMTYSLSPAFDDYMAALTASFEATHPGREVEWIDFPADGYLDKLMLLHQSGEPPDVVNLTFDLGAQVVQQGVLEDIRPLLPPEVIGGYLPGILASACETGGRVHGLPWYLSPVVLLHNRALMAEAGLDPDHPPATFDEQIAMSRQIHGRLPGRWGFFESLTEAGHLRDLLFQQSVPLVTPGEPRRAAFATPAGAEVLALWVELYQSGVIPRESLQPTHVRGIELFKTGRTAFLVTGAQFLRSVQEDAPDVYAQCGVARAPEMPCGLTAVDVMMLSVTDHGESAAAVERERGAAELAAFVTNASNQLALCRRAVVFPSVTAALEDPLFRESDGTLLGDARVVGARTLETARVFREILPESGRLNQAMSRAVERACLEGVAPADALAEAAAAWDAVFASLPSGAP